MQSKSLLIAIAAFAVTTTGVHAYGGGNILERAGLTSQQISALVQAHELKETGELAAARDVLVEAGIDEKTLLAIHHAKQSARLDMHAALALEDFEAFTEAIKGTPLADIVVTEEDFALFQEAYELRQSGELSSAQEILQQMGIERHARYHQAGYGHEQVELSDEQKEAMVVARQANDREAVRAILDEAGVGRSWR